MPGMSEKAEAKFIDPSVLANSRVHSDLSPFLPIVPEKEERLSGGIVWFS